jgi:anti-sigma factor RsiW
MNKNLKDILGNSSTPVVPDQLMAYLNKELSPQEAQAVEEKLAADEFAQMALEGLEAVANKKQLNALNNQLNRELKKKIEKRNRARKKLKLNQPPLVLAAVLLLLLLIVLIFMVIARLQS